LDVKSECEHFFQCQIDTALLQTVLIRKPALQLRGDAR
jgi:hypothetical protein